MADIRHIGDLKPDARNARRHNPRNIGMIADALHEVGAARSIVIDEDGNVLAGNGTVEAAAQAGIERVRVIEADGNEIIAVQRSGLSKRDKKRLALYDNRTAELAEWEPDVLAEERDILAGMFTTQELDDLLAGITQEEAADDPGAQIDRAAELQEKWQTERGQLWQVGRHRLLCGDSTSAADVARLMGGAGVDIVLSDPPYSSGGFQEAQRSTGSIGTRQNVKIKSDQLSTRGYISLMSDVLDRVQADVLYLFTDWRMWSWTYDIAERKNYPVRNMLVWDKGQMGMGFPWRSTHELILFAKRTPSAMMDGKRGNVLRCDRTGNVNHPTEKPSELLVDILSNTPPGDVYDPFIGSGTTMVAAEQTRRICYGCDLDPRYIAVALERMAGMGLEPRRVDG